MSKVLGIDLRLSFNIDLVTIDETTDDADWTRLSLGDEKVPALDRLRQVSFVMPTASFYDDIFLIAIEEPYGSNQAADAGEAEPRSRRRDRVPAVRDPDLDGHAGRLAQRSRSEGQREYQRGTAISHALNVFPLRPIWAPLLFTPIKRNNLRRGYIR